MKFFAKITRLEDICKPEYYTDELNAQTKMLESACNFLKKRGLSAVSDDGTSFEKEKINEIIDAGFEISEPDSQGFYEFVVDADSISIVTEEESLEIQIYETELPSNIVNAIYCETDRAYKLDDAKAQLMLYLNIENDEDLLEAIKQENPFSEIDDEHRIETVLNAIVDAFDKKFDANNDENSMWYEACKRVCIV